MYYYSIAKDGKTHGSQRGVYAISSIKRLSLSLRLLTERVMIMMMREMIGMRNLANYRDGSIQKFVIFLVRSAKQHFRDKKYRIRSTTPAVALDQRRRLTLSWKLRTHRGGCQPLVGQAYH